MNHFLLSVYKTQHLHFHSARQTVSTNIASNCSQNITKPSSLLENLRLSKFVWTLTAMTIKHATLTTNTQISNVIDFNIACCCLLYVDFSKFGSVKLSFSFRMQRKSPETHCTTFTNVSRI